MEASQKLVYVVDDDEPVRTALTRSLEKRGYSVQSYDSGDAFLNITRLATLHVLCWMFACRA